jgi:type IV pilus assembly protein PilQ
MRLGKLAILIAIAAAALHCSGHPPVSEPGQAALEVPAAVVVSAVDHSTTPSGTQVVLHGNYPFSFTTYQPEPTTLVVELLEVKAQGMSDEIRLDTPQVGAVAVSNVQGVDGGNIAKFEFHNVQAARHSVHLEGNDLMIDFPTLSDSENLPEPPLVAGGKDGNGTASPAPSDNGGTLQPIDAPLAAEKPQPGNASEPPAPAPHTDKKPDGGTLSPVVRGPAPKGPAAHNLVGVKAEAAGAEPRVVLRADGAVREEHFELPNPPRLVVDLVGVVDKTPKAEKTTTVDSSVLTRVRVAQFAMKPQPVARIVFDLKSAAPYAVETAKNSVAVDFSADAVRRAAAAQPGSQPAPPESAPTQPLAAETPDAASPTPAPSPEPASPPPADKAAPEANEPPVPADAAPLPELPKPEPNPLLSQGDVKVEGKQTKEVPFKPAPSKARPGNETFVLAQAHTDTRTISDTGPKYTGKRVSFNFKDADLKDVFRLFHELTGYNIVLDPAVSGSLTIVLENVPEDQALDIILKNNGLDKVFENNVIRIASTQKLAAEAAARKALIEAQELEQDPVTFTRKLSYAKAKDVVPIIKKIMSKRGDVIMDDRTNTLIITDLKDRQDPLSRLIDNLDEQTPQVTIEARIVETDRDFERDLGITWGAKAFADNAHGTQLPFAFPHSGNVTWDVTVPAPAHAGQLGVNFGNVLDTFQLNATLDAFETNGDVKVLSSPRIATQNNQKATIEQGTQIPVVSTTATQINVEFISASLKLEVTPQITREGTVIMDLKVDNSSPDFVNRVGDVPPILTERAQTQILVKDGGTAVIGGIFKLNDSVTQAGVPGLQRIPGLGWLFRSKTINRKNTELLIFITPRINKKAEATEDNS